MTIKMKKQGEECLFEMKQIAEKYKYDTEKCHSYADDLLIQFVRKLGFSELAEEYERLPKWYA